MAKTYKALESVEVPSAVPQLGVAPGDRGVIAHVWDGGRMLDVEIPKAGGTSAGFVDLEVLPGDALRVVGYSVLSAHRPGPTP